MAQNKKLAVKGKNTKSRKEETPAGKIVQRRDQGDLEAINKRLARSQAELEVEYRQYTDLYDFAPVGYFTLARDGTVYQVNLAGANLLGVDHTELPQLLLAAFVSAKSRPVFDAFFKRLLSGEGKENCELEMEQNGRDPLWVRLEATCFEGGEESRAMLVDITERWRMEQALQESENRFRMLLQDVPTIAVQGYAIDGTTQYWNTASEKLYGYSAQEAIGQSLLDLIIPPEMRNEVWEAIQQMGKTGHTIPASELSLMRKGGSRVPVYSSHAIVSVLGREPELFCLDIDLTERKQAEEKLAYQANLLANVSDAIIASDAEYRLTVWNSAAEMLYGWKAEEVLGRNGLEVIQTQWSEEDAESMRQTIAQTGRWRGEATQVRRDGTRIPVEISSLTLRDARGHVAGYISVNRDITLRKQSEDELHRARESLMTMNLELETALAREKQLAYTDALTGINNRRHLYELAEHEFEISSRYRQPLSVIMFDLDHFKEVNDIFGHAVGDHMLQRVTQIAHSELRSADVIGRYGGEEFVIVLPMTKAQQAYSLAERIRTGVAALCVPTEKGDACVTLSIGIVEIYHPPQTDSAEDMIRRADEAMYAAKQAGRNRTEIGRQGSDMP
jgi:diguanylate cyclase (GGDEF)-like protein/PAS domain S-box-containing protein